MGGSLDRCERLGFVCAIVATCGGGKAGMQRSLSRRGSAWSRKLELTSQTYKGTGGTGHKHKERKDKVGKIQR